MVHHTYTVRLEPAEEGGFVVTVPALPGCVTEGDTYEEALENAEEAILGFIEFLQKEGLDVPREEVPEKEESFVRVRVATPVAV